MTEPDEPCGTHVLPPHHRLLVWEAGPEAALSWALRHLLGRYGPSGIVPGSVCLGGARVKPKRPQRARTGLFDPR